MTAVVTPEGGVSWEQQLPHTHSLMLVIDDDDDDDEREGGSLTH